MRAKYAERFPALRQYQPPCKLARAVRATKLNTTRSQAAKWPPLRSQVTEVPASINLEYTLDSKTMQVQRTKDHRRVPTEETANRPTMARRNDFILTFGMNKIKHLRSQSINLIFRYGSRGGHRRLYMWYPWPDKVGQILGQSNP